MLFDDSIRFFSGDGKLIGEKQIKDARVTFFDSRSNGAVLVCENLNINGGYTFMSFDKNGKEICSANTESKLSGVYAPSEGSSYAGYFISIEGELTAVSPDGKLVLLTEDKSVKAITDTSSGPVAMAPTKAYLVSDKK